MVGNLIYDRLIILLHVSESGVNDLLETEHLMTLMPFSSLSLQKKHSSTHFDIERSLSYYTCYLLKDIDSDHDLVIRLCNDSGL